MYHIAHHQPQRGRAQANANKYVVTDDRAVSRLQCPPKHRDVPVNALECHGLGYATSTNQKILLLVVCFQLFVYTYQC